MLIIVYTNTYWVVLYEVPNPRSGFCALVFYANFIARMVGPGDFNPDDIAETFNKVKILYPVDDFQSSYGFCFLSWVWQNLSPMIWTPFIYHSQDCCAF